MAKKRLRPEDEVAEDKSRSQKKRESSALQKRGEQLAALSPSIQARLPLSPDLRQALDDWRGLKTWEAKRRHMQYVGRLMREQDDLEALLEALDALSARSFREAGAFRHIEALRDSLLQPEAGLRAEALEKALAEHPALERGRLSHLAEAALAEREKQRPPRQARALFRYLREQIEDGE